MSVQNAAAACLSDLSPAARAALGDALRAMNALKEARRYYQSKEDRAKRLISRETGVELTDDGLANLWLAMTS